MRHSVSIVILFIAVLLVGCSSGGAKTPEAAAQNWVNALFSANGEQLRANMCAAQAIVLGETVMRGISEGLAQGGAVDVSGLTYTYNPATQAVTIGGVVRISVAGRTIDRSLSELNLNILPVIQEDGAWKVCLRV